MGKNREIGKDNKLLWDLPEDMKHFRKRTKKKAVIMGRKTFESIGNPLPNRQNIVLSRNKDLKIEGVEVFDDIEKAFEHLEAQDKKEVMIIGGSSIYEEAFYFATHLSLTIVEENFPEADSFFPAFPDNIFHITSEEYFKKDDHHKYDFVIRELGRR